MERPPGLTPAVQYLRMSSEQQRYSLESQRAVIASYAAAHGYQIRRSYQDAARSGLHLKGRAGLQTLLRDALREDRDFEAILVLDVTRWGRFQDLDQGAHYEFVCRSAGAPVVYCAEPFDNDGQTRSALVKQLKRLMAAEYSRELSAKSAAGRLSQARLGHRQGGPLIYGVERVLVDRAGRVVHRLERGQRKAQHDTYVIMRPGPAGELTTLRWIFRRYLSPGSTVSSVARELNAAGTPYIGARPWEPGSLARLIRHELMIGLYVFNRRSCRLKTPPIPNAPEKWVRVQVFDPIVTPTIFARAQAKLARSRRRRTRPELLAALRALLRTQGRLSASVIKRSAATPSVGAYLNNFGSLKAAYEAIGYRPGVRDK
jgi:DNA invertase Pin-like site-specific DNA recombinase